jgi:hypothetical protein
MRAAKDVKRESVDSHRGGHTHFKAVSDFEPTKEELAIWQTSLGYNPLGYDGPYGISIRREQETFVTTWRCYNSCD